MADKVEDNMKGMGGTESGGGTSDGTTIVDKGVPPKQESKKEKEKQVDELIQKELNLYQ